MGNFGWDAIYRPMGGPFVAEADRALAAYRQGIGSASVWA
jgi:hypothetical protein